MLQALDELRQPVVEPYEMVQAAHPLVRALLLEQKAFPLECGLEGEHAHRV